MLARIAVAEIEASSRAAPSGAAVLVGSSSDAVRRAVPLSGPSADDRHRVALSKAASQLLGVAKYWPTGQLEFPPLPRSEPDVSRLSGVKASGLPMRVRIFIDATGTVRDVEVIQADILDEEATDRVRDMFLATAFLPGKRESSAVASYMDIELDLRSLVQ